MKHLRVLRGRLTPLLSSPEIEEAVNHPKISTAFEKAPRRSIRFLQQVEEQNRKEAEEKRRNALDDQELKADLEKQYGDNRWAKNLISEVLNSRKDGLDYKFES